ncbi:MAG: hypothetical protein EOM73_08885, partial [Bacteroidia bacterium]|nr:hypothetical protein [Bacteroidia bacterium]
MSAMKNILFLFFMLVVITGFSQIETTNPSPLTIEKIMQNPDRWIGVSPDRVSWDDNSSKVYFEWNPEQDTLASLYLYSLKDKKTEKVSPEEKAELPGRFSAYNSAKTLKVFIRNGNLFLTDLKKGTEKQLTDWLQRVSSPKFALNDSHISFQLDQNLFLLNTETGSISQVTN